MCPQGKAAAAQAKAAEVDQRHGIRDKANGAKSRAQSEAAKAKKAANIKLHGTVAEQFYEVDPPRPMSFWAQWGRTAQNAALIVCAASLFSPPLAQFDDDDSGFLDEEEVVAFIQKLGLVLSPEDMCQALDEMEMDGSRDGKVSFDEFGAPPPPRALPTALLATPDHPALPPANPQ
eukprot:SAG11_NODE_2365_length_3457_cov_1.677189_3_plen_176_part_00